jgi:hypothetical protein
MARPLRFAIAAAASTAILLLLTLGAYKLHLWAGGRISNLDGTLRLLMFLPIILGFAAGLWPSRRSPFAAGVTGAVIGLACGYCWPRVHFAMSIGHWRWQYLGIMNWGYDLALLVCAVVPGTCAMLLAVTARSRRVIATVVTLILTALLVPAPASDLISHNRELTVAVVIPCNDDATSEPRVTADVYATPVDVGIVIKQVLGLLRNEGITGRYRVSDLYRAGHGKKALAVIVLNQPVATKVDLQEPRGGEVIYLQQPDGWKRIPPQLPTLSLPLTIEPPVSEKALAGLMVTEVGGFRAGLEIWKTPD